MSRLAYVLGAAAVLVSTAAFAEIGRHHRLRPQALPPVSGTLRMAPQDFGTSRRITTPPPVVVRRRPPVGPETVAVVRGGLFPQVMPVPVFGGGSAAERWATGGTGVSGLIGNTGNPFAGEAAWGTADSATTGVAPPPRFAGSRRGLFTSGASGRSLASTFGEPPVTSVSDGLPAYGSAPPVTFYGSGTPYSLGYYSSGSSAGPYGSPGGLGVYRSGSYGYGPRIIRIGTVGPGWARRGCACGPHILHLGRSRTAGR